MEKRRDPLTNELFEPKRRNQRFATAENRIRYHNELQAKKRDELAPYTRAINKNIRILEELMEGKNKEWFHMAFLLGKGYTFNAYTDVVFRDGKRCARVYHYIIREEDHRPYLCITRHEN